MFQPARLMPAIRIMVGPVNYTTLVIPFIFSLESDGISRLQGCYPRCHIDIVGDEQCLSGIQSENEALMTTALVVIREYPDYRPLAADLYIALVLPVSVTNF